MIHICEELFESGTNADVTIWNAMINAYGINGELMKAKDLLNDMREKGIMPDSKTFISLIHCCSHCGDLEEGRKIWEEINDDEVKYNYYVVTALIDGYARKGALQKAYDLLMDLMVNLKVM